MYVTCCRPQVMLSRKASALFRVITLGLEFSKSLPGDLMWISFFLESIAHSGFLSFPAPPSNAPRKSTEVTGLVGRVSVTSGTWRFWPFVLFILIICTTSAALDAGAHVMAWSKSKRQAAKRIEARVGMGGPPKRQVKFFWFSVITR